MIFASVRHLLSFQISTFDSRKMKQTILHNRALVFMVKRKLLVLVFMVSNF